MSADIRRNMLLVEGFSSPSPTKDQQLAIIESIIWSTRIIEGPESQSFASNLSRRVQSLVNAGKTFSLDAARQAYSNALGRLNQADPQVKSAASKLIRSSGRSLGTVGGLLAGAAVIASLMSAPAQAHDVAADVATMAQTVTQARQTLDKMKQMQADMAGPQDAATTTQQPAARSGLPTEFKPQFDQASLNTLGGKEEYDWSIYGRDLSKAIYAVNQQLDHAKERPQEYAGFTTPIPQPPVFRTNDDISNYTDALKQWSQSAFQYALDRDPQMIAAKKKTAAYQKREQDVFAGAHDAVNRIGQTTQGAVNRAGAGTTR